MSGTAAPAPPMAGDIEGALAEVSVPAYALDSRGIVRWENAAAQKLVGKARGRQFTTLVAPEQQLEVREAFAHNVLGAKGAKDAKVELKRADGSRVPVEICSAPLRDGKRVVGMFGLATRMHKPIAPRVTPHLTP